MKEITILSGKGGTGKTSVTAALASVAKNTVFCDNDVDAADLHLLFDPKIEETNRFISGWIANIDYDKCSNCGVCADHCRFGAIHEDEEETFYINPFQCEGCRLCERVCPTEAIVSEQSDNNFWYVSDTRFGKMVHAKMGPGEENSGKLVTVVRKRAKEIANAEEADFLLNDGPPGIGCSAISALSGTNRVLLVIEPTKSGLHDARRLVELIESFQIETYAVVNKFDLNKTVTSEIETFLKTKAIPLVAKIPFDDEMVKAMIAGKTIVEHKPASEISALFADIWASITSN